MTPTIQKVSTYSTLELALMAILGYVGVGSERRTILGARYEEVQKVVNTILAGTVPAGSGTSTADVSAALHKVFDKLIDQISEGVTNEL